MKKTDTQAVTHDPHGTLLAQYAAGDALAARRLVADLGPIVFAHAVRLLGDRAEAEDVSQEAMLRLWRIAPEWETGRARVTTWLYTVTGNLCLDRLRKRRSDQASLELVPDPADPAPGAEARMIAAAREGALQTALDGLPDRQRHALVLRHIEGLSNPDIAQIMDIGIEAVESLTARGKRGLTKALADQRAALGFDDDQTG